MGTWKPSDCLQVQAGLVNGWNALDRDDDRAAFMGGIRYTDPDKNWWTSFAIITGEESTNVAGLPGIANGLANRTRYSYLFDATLTERIEYIFHQWLGFQADGAPAGGTAYWYGLDQYLYYTLTDCWRLGGRFEWFRDEDGTRVGLNRPSNPNKPPLPGNYYSLTVGPDWTPNPNWLVRPALRWDFYDGSAKPFDDGTKENQLLLGLDVIVQF